MEVKMRRKRKKNKNIKSTLLSILLMFLYLLCQPPTWGVIFLGSGIIFFLFQVFCWLLYGNWISGSIIALLSLTNGPIANWAMYPDSWYGLHKILEVVSLPLVLIISGLGILFRL